MTDAKTDNEGRRLNWRQACELLGCSKSQFYRLIALGQLRAFRVGPSRRNLWVYESDCRKLIAQVGM